MLGLNWVQISVCTDQLQTIKVANLRQRVVKQCIYEIGSKLYRRIVITPKEVIMCMCFFCCDLFSFALKETSYFLY